MFSESTVFYRAGISIQIGGNRYAYSLDYFMKHFVEYSSKKMQSIARFNKNQSKPIELKKVEDFLQASQSIISREDANSEYNFGNPSEFFTFTINGRNIFCPHEKKGYVFDLNLAEMYPDFFPKAEISYLEMACFIADRIHKYARPGYKLQVDATIANSVIGIIQGEKFSDENIEVLSLLIAALLLAEPKRNPSSFVPTLMILELIRNKCKTPFGDLYAWDNCLQHDVLVNQSGGGQSAHHAYIYPMLAGVPGRIDLQKNEKIALSEHERAFMNADKKFNKVSNQKNIRPSDYLIQLGGYFPLTHRFSNSELKEKRAEAITALSDKKCFIAISDWLMFHKLASNIHHNQLFKRLHPNLDMEKAILTEVIFPEIWDKALQFKKPKFEAMPIASKSYPSLLTLFGCKRKKATPERVANAIYLISTSSKTEYGTAKAEELKRQFQFWSAQNENKFGIEEVEKAIAQNYQL